MFLAKKYYGVHVGRKPGVYENWDDCKAQIDGYSGAKYRGFGSGDRAAAELYVKHGDAYIDFLCGGDKPFSKSEKAEASSTKDDIPRGAYAYVDGSYNPATETAGWGVLMYGPETDDGSERSKVEMYGPCGSGGFSAQYRNIVGEIHGVREAVSCAFRNGYRSLHIYHDYIGLAHWGAVEAPWKANTELTKEYVEFIRMVRMTGFELTFEQVPAHSGIKGNERADELAKLGAGCSVDGADGPSLG